MKQYRIGLIITGLILFSGSLMAQVPKEEEQEASNEDHPDLKKHDTLTLNQQNGPEIQVVGYGRLHLSYSETVDGYTILRNDNGVYEYAERAGGGDLKPAGIVAHNPGERKREEIIFLRDTPKHLRYKDPKLEKIQNKQTRFPRIQSD